MARCEWPGVNGPMRRLLARCCSPAEIANRMKYERRHGPRRCVSASTIDRWIERQGDDRRRWKSFLRRRGRRPDRRKTPGVSPNSRIAARPAVIERRGRIGGFEGDLVLGKQGAGGLQTLVDRKSRYTLLMKVTRKQAAYVYRKTRQRLSQLSPDKRHSVTASRMTTAVSSPSADGWNNASA